MSTKTPNQEDDFYRDMDEKAVKKSCCSLPLLIVFFLLLTAAVAVTVFFAYGYIKNFRPSNKNLNFLPSEVLSKFKSGDKSPTLSVSLSSQELTDLLSGSDAVISDKKAEILPDTVQISGKYSSFIKVDTILKTVPKVEAGRLKFAVEGIQIKKIPLPKFLGGLMEKSINSLLDEQLNDFYQKYEVTKVEASSDKLTIMGKLK